jgi:galactonate dehydratase
MGHSLPQLKNKEYSNPMKIIDIEPVVVHVNRRGDWVFVLVHTDAGITGLGEASHSSNDALVLAVLQQFKQQLIGESPLAIEVILQKLVKFNAGRVIETALSGLEQALWDVLGQHLGVPIHVLFGGALRPKLRLYANINRHVADRRPEGFAEAARQAVAEGFTAIKLAPFDEVRGPLHDHTSTKAAWRIGIERVRAVRTAIGDEVELAVDCHSRFDRSEALLVAKALADCNLFWFEEPVHHSYHDDLAEITRTVPMPTASAESIFGIEGFAPFLSRRLVDALMPDVKHVGGLMALKNIAAAARMHKLLLAPHNPSGPVASAATAQVASTAANFYILEHAWGEVDWRADLLSPPERIENCELVLSSEPGLGHRLNPDVVAAHRVKTASAADSSKVVTG